MAAVEDANRGMMSSYGEDEWTARVRNHVCELFETDCAVFFTSTGTSANALALAQLCQSFHAVVCHEYAHLQTDECGAPEFFTKGSKLLLVGGDNAKINLAEAEAVIGQQPPLHSHKPRVISITQSTELGTIYSADEIAAVGKSARSRGLFVHMDGARFANAIASLSCPPKDVTWRAGVDVLCFGGTKNGLAGAELVVFFNKGLATDFDYHLKQAGQLQSKTRFMAAQWCGLFSGDVWLRNARHANQMASTLAAELQSEAKLTPVFPVQANAVFVRFDARLARGLKERGWHLYQFVEPDIFRMMCSWATIQSDVDQFVSDVVCIRQSLSL
jgi:threonine aldolase